MKRRNIFKILLVAEIGLIVFAFFLPGPEKWVLIGLSLIGIALFATKIHHSRKKTESDETTPT